MRVLRRGFTLIEIMVVVAILSILVIASLPTFRNFFITSRLRQGCYDVMSALRSAREAAITKPTPPDEEFYNMAVFYTDYQALWSAVEVYNIAEGSIGGWKRLPPRIIIDTSSPESKLDTRNGLAKPGESTYNSQLYVVEFNRKGEARNNAIIVLKDLSKGYTAQIKVLHSTGRVRIKEFRGVVIEE